MTPPTNSTYSVYDVFQGLERLAIAGDPAPLLLALRAAFHPDLAPFLTNGLLQIGDEYPNLDARAAALVEFARGQRGAGLDYLLSPEDRATAQSLLPDTFVTEGANPFAPAVGAIWGSVYVPAQGRAALCRVVAVLDNTPTDHWSTPIATRPIAASTQQAAQNALVAALALLTQARALPPLLRPCPLFFDVWTPDLPAAFAEGVSGPSLELPLTLCFVSALAGVPLDPFLGATGALGRVNPDSLAIAPVGHTVEKAEALWRLARTHAAPAAVFAPRFLVPVPDRQEQGGAGEWLPTPVSTLWEVAQLGLPPPAGQWTPASPLDPLPPASGVRPVLCLRWEKGATDTIPPARVLALRACLFHGGFMLPPRPDTPHEVIVFPDPASACAAAVAARQAVACAVSANSGDAMATLPLPSIGIGLEPWSGTDAPGLGGRAAALADAAPSGHILLGADLHHALPSPAPFSFASCGERRLADLATAALVYRLLLPNDNVAPDLLTLDRVPNNLPVQAIPLLGRESELFQIEQAIRGDGQRCITLSGDAGVGKTRLALAVAARCASAFADGVWLVPLQQARSGDDVAVAIAETLNLTPLPGQKSAGETVRAALPGKRLLLLLDNGEDIADGSKSFLTTLLNEVPGLVCVTTARVPLKFAGETVFRLTPLATPSALPADPATLLASPAVAFFVACVQAADPRWSPSPGDLTLIAAICQRLEGSPFALQLTAAYRGEWTLTQIEQRLAPAFTRPDDAPDGGGGGRMVRRILEWTFALLTQAEQDLLLRLSVFADGFTLAAAAFVSATPAETRDLLTGLQHRSLVERAEVGDVTRYSLVGQVREFVRQKQIAETEWDVRARHAEYFFQLAEQLGEQGDTDEEFVAFNQLDTNMANLRAAFDRLRATQPDRIPLFVTHLTDFLRYRGHLREWQAWPRYALTLVETGGGTLQPRDAARLYHRHARSLLDARASLDDAAYYLNTAYNFAIAHNLWREAANTRNLRGLFHSRAGDYGAAIADHREAYELYAQSGSHYGQITATNDGGLAALRAKDYATAHAAFTHATTLCRRFNDLRGLAYAENNLGDIASREGNWSLAQKHFFAAQEILREQREAVTLATVLMNLGEAVAKQGRGEQALPVLTLAHAMFVLLNHPYAGNAHEIIADVVATQGGAGEQALDRLRSQWANQTLAALQQADPWPADGLEDPAPVGPPPTVQGGKLQFPPQRLDF